MSKMESKILGYSTKNIPLSGRDSYTKQLICKTEHFIKRLRWKVFHFLRRMDSEDVVSNNFGFVSLKTPPKNPLLYGFENDMYDLIGSIQFKKVRSSFQFKLKEDLKAIKNENKVYVNADKTRNLYGIEPEAHEKLLLDTITDKYRKCTPKEVADVNREAKNIVSDIGLSDRVQVLTEDPAFITIKDHKPHFPRKIQCRLLNPSKSHLGKISKHYIQEINDEIRNKCMLNQWRSTAVVVE